MLVTLKSHAKLSLGVRECMHMELEEDMRLIQLHVLYKGFYADFS